ncbi:hypothetical protein BGZ80_008454 [Entomortierella chlamydospora]|uniref:Crinkler effector protein N-terminal domain-containing protein n=1 Tax=Entomortierella chlamydospora TaxID=101097 RepID=A0A9P6MXD3_9FUNG|nr:hypothetical protein BGZ80_008454 [Entomortierella chlamydospora]
MAGKLQLFLSHTVDNLKKLIKVEKSIDFVSIDFVSIDFVSIDADKLMLWQVSVPVADIEDAIANFDLVDKKKKAGAATPSPNCFSEDLAKETIHSVIQRLPLR